MQLVQVATPTGVGQQSIVFVLITNAAVYILKKGEWSVIAWTLRYCCLYLCILVCCVWLRCDQISLLQMELRGCSPNKWASTTVTLSTSWWVCVHCIFMWTIHVNQTPLFCLSPSMNPPCSPPLLWILYLMNQRRCEAPRALPKCCISTFICHWLSI